jgi:hypothetical protein
MTESLDIDCAMNLLAKQAAEIAQKTGACACCTYLRCTYGIRSLGVLRLCVHLGRRYAGPILRSCVMPRLAFVLIVLDATVLRHHH